MKEVTCDEEKNCFVDMENSNKDIPEDLLPLKSLKTGKKRRVTRRAPIKGKGRRKRNSLKKPLAVTRRKKRRSKKTKKRAHKKNVRRVRRKR